MAAYLACWRVRRARVAGCLPVAPDPAWAAFCFGLRDLAAVVDGAALGLRLGFWAAGVRTSNDAWPDLARGCLADLETVVSAGTNAGVDGYPISCLSIVTIRLNITAPYYQQT